MLFALWDYCQYRLRFGRFGAHQPSGMGMGYLGQIPQALLDDLWVGDLILTQRLDSNFSWAMLYYTSSSIDHTAIYIGEGRVAHLTLSGYREHSLRAIAKNTRILPLRLFPDGDPMEFEDDGFKAMEPRKRWLHILPPKAQLTWVGFRILLGFHPDRFRWKFLADVLLAGIAADLLTFWITALPLFTIIGSVGATFSALNYLSLRVRQRFGHKVERLNHPDMLYRVFGRDGGLMFSKLGPLVASPIGLLPLEVFRSLGRESAEDGPDDKFEPLRQNIRDLIEGWYLAEATDHSKYHQGDQHDDEEV